METVESSYAENNFGVVFETLVMQKMPITCVELGVLYGYSSLHIGLALKYNYDGVEGHLHSYDLWEDYPYNHGNKDSVQGLLERNEIDGYVSLYHADAMKVHELYGEKQVDLLHVDISNHGDIFNFMMERWHPILKVNGVFLFEGGSEERDYKIWMLNYKYPSIKKAIETNEIVKSFYQYETYTKFPSLTVFTKKGE
ncbi:hypothetical protein LCGC14_1398250 [marine sediment metagenome]|uniref:Class I SAM-dependent methyltransferase n=2 Tax=marine sediment metagenome TaxID=412755 RepID=A0A0F9JXW4_9ZZZZ